MVQPIKNAFTLVWAKNNENKHSNILKTNIKYRRQILYFANNIGYTGCC